MTLSIGIIECGEIPAALRGRHDSYPGMFAAQLEPLLPGTQFETVSVVNGVALPAPDAKDAWLIPGSRHGVYHGLPWIEPLKSFIRDVAVLKRPLAGVCFGHQVIAEALGGRVEKATVGWRVGLERYELLSVPSHGSGGGSGSDSPSSLVVPAFHQDQIVLPPPRADILARNAACPFAALRYKDAPILTVQFHPEFSLAYLADLIAVLAKQAALPGLPPMAQVDDAGMRWIAAALTGR